jgi:hypothetical protein
LNANISLTIQAIAMKKQPIQRPFNSLPNVVWFDGYIRAIEMIKMATWKKSTQKQSFNRF